MPQEVHLFVDLAAVYPVLRVVLVVAGVHDEDVATLDLQSGVRLPLLEVLGAVDLVVTDAELRQVDDAGRPDQPVEREVADELPARVEVGRRVKVRADVKGGGDLLPADGLERQPLDPFDGRPAVVDEPWGVVTEVLRQV